MKCKNDNWEILTTEDLNENLFIDISKKIDELKEKFVKNVKSINA